MEQFKEATKNVPGFGEISLVSGFLFNFKLALNV